MTAILPSLLAALLKSPLRTPPICRGWTGVSCRRDGSIRLDGSAATTAWMLPASNADTSNMTVRRDM